MLENLKKGERTLGVVFVAILGIFLITLIVSEAIEIKDKIESTNNTIVVSATGEIQAKPDLALATFSVITEAKSVSEALAENTIKMNSVIDSVKRQGVEGKDIKTISFNVYPRYEWHKEEECVPSCSEGKRVLVGYEVQQSLQVKIRDMAKIGGIIEGATEAGANEVGDLQFTIDQEDEFKAKAREEAIEKAKNKAKELSSQLGVKLGRVTSFNESNQVPYFSSYRLEASAINKEAPIPTIETGENKILVTVIITYEIR